MGFHRKVKLKSAFAALIAGTLMLSAMPVMPWAQTASAAGTCNIDPSTVHQTIQGFGGINHREWTGSDLTG